MRLVLIFYMIALEIMFKKYLHILRRQFNKASLDVFLLNPIRILLL